MSRTGRPVPEAEGRTWLFVPGDRPDRFDTAAGSGADQVVIDLEDAVAPDAASPARRAVARYLGHGGRAWVRVSSTRAVSHLEDVAAVSGLPGLLGVVLPKADLDAVRTAASKLGDDVPVVALVESAAGVVEVSAVAAHPAVARLAFGAIDFALDVGAQEDDTSLLLARSTLVLASRAAGLPGPIDGVTPQLRDAGRVERDARRSRALGFTGKLCIHPEQLRPVAGAFLPTADEVSWARQVLGAVDPDRGAAVRAGQLVDRPVLERARRIIATCASSHA